MEKVIVTSGGRRLVYSRRLDKYAIELTNGRMASVWFGASEAEGYINRPSSMVRKALLNI